MPSPTARPSCPIAGTYDDVNRLCLEVADETGWGFVNINLRPFYAEGSKTLAYEIAEALGWRSPDVIVGPIAIGRDVHAGRPRLRGARRRSGSSSAGPSASSAARRPAAPRSRPPSAGGTDVIAGPRARTRSSARWRSATRPTGATPSSSRATSGGSIEAIQDARHRRCDPRRRATRGHLPRDGRRRDAGRGRRRPATRRHPRRRRGRRAPHRQRPQDPGRARLSGCRRRRGAGPARPARPGPGHPAQPVAPSKRGSRAAS